ncbi:MAG: FKBP-type peptidyl-prolyl cis-trans isomerase [Acidobacteria bacterium]|nr:FKBP-type peptidyl-prolyl cis-trans isomerase [Acidobacteriota bacterium]
MALALLTIGCNRDSGSPTDPSQVNIEFTTTDLVVGTGAQAAAGNALTVNYTGWLYNPQSTDSKGAQFDTSIGKVPLAVSPLGRANFIPGFQQAIVGMRVGGKRRAYIPPGLAYGSAGNGPIPPNASVVFEIELLTLVQ